MQWSVPSIMDHRGTAYMVLDSTGAVVSTRQYDAFGVLISETPASSWPTDLAYQSNWQTIKVGTKWWGLSPSRLYDFDTGRFTQRDPVYCMPFYNAFAHNPIMIADPDGRRNVSVDPRSLMMASGASSGLGWWWNYVKNAGTELGTDIWATSLPGQIAGLAGNRTTQRRQSQQGAQLEALAAGAIATLPIANRWSNSVYGDALQRARAAGGSTAGFCGVYYVGVAAGVAEQILAAKAAMPNIGLYLKSPLRYEIGSKTFPEAIWNAIKNTSFGQMNPVERGAALIEEFGWGYALEPGTLSLGIIEKSFGTGPTPGFWLLIYAAGWGATAFMNER